MLFFKKRPAFTLGIDFGAGGIKLVQLAPQAQGGKLFTYGYVERKAQEVGGDYLRDNQETSDLLKKLLTGARTTIPQAVAALPIPVVFSTVVSIPEVAERELPQAVQWEAKKLIPLPLEEMQLDFKKLPRVKLVKNPSTAVASAGGLATAQDKTSAVLLTAAPKSIIEKYLRVCQDSGLELISLETEAFALIRALLHNDPTPTILVDIGAVRSNILIVDHGIPYLTRSLELGGKRCTEVLANALNLPLESAEEAKRALQGTLPLALQEVFKPLLTEINYSLNVYRTRSVAGRTPERIVLTGGGALLAGLPEFFSEFFKLRTFLGDPWQRVSTHPDLAETLANLGPRFAVAVGLALK